MWITNAKDIIFTPKLVQLSIMKLGWEIKEFNTLFMKVIVIHYLHDSQALWYSCRSVTLDPTMSVALNRKWRSFSGSPSTLPKRPSQLPGRLLGMVNLLYVRYADSPTKGGGLRFITIFQPENKHQK